MQTSWRRNISHTGNHTIVLSSNLLLKFIEGNANTYQYLIWVYRVEVYYWYKDSFYSFLSSFPRKRTYGNPTKSIFVPPNGQNSI